MKNGGLVKAMWIGRVTKDVLAKYTELIVRECAGVAEKERLYQTSDLIKKHFGVEV